MLIRPVIRYTEKRVTSLLEIGAISLYERVRNRGCFGSDMISAHM